MAAPKAKKFPYAQETDEWDRAADVIARGFAPEFKPCRDCGGPVADGFCCEHCGSATP